MSLKSVSLPGHAFWTCPRWRAALTSTVRITLDRIKRLAPRATIWDTDVKGFGARRQRETASYFLKTRIRGRQR